MRLPPNAPAQLREIASRFESMRAGQRLGALADAAALLRQHGISWSDLLDAIDLDSADPVRLEPPR